MNLRFVTGVWGKWHTDVFLSINLPSLLASGNFPKVGKKGANVFDVYSSTTDAETIRRSKIFQTISATIPTTLTALNDRQLGTSAVGQEEIWRKGAELARKAGQAVVFLAPDMFWSNGAMAEIAASFERGNRAIYMTVLRALEETFAPAILSRPGRSTAGSLSISKQELTKLIFKHFQALHMVSQYRAPYQLFHQEHLFWMIPEEGLLARTLAAHSLGIDPSFFILNEKFSPNRVSASDPIEFAPGNQDIFGVSLTPLFKDIDWYFDQRNFDDNYRGEWWTVFANPVHPRLASVPFKFTLGGTAIAPWQSAEHASASVVRRSLIARDLHYLRIGLKSDERCSQAALLIAVAAQGKLLSRWHDRSPLTFLVPVNQAFADLPHWFEEIMNPREERQLFHLLRRHVIRDTIDLDATTHLEARRPPKYGTYHARTVRTLDRRNLAVEHKAGAVTIGGAEVLGKIDVANGSVCYLIDRVLF